jgi:hypothetical protein
MQNSPQSLRETSRPVQAWEPHNSDPVCNVLCRSFAKEESCMTLMDKTSVILAVVGCQHHMNMTPSLISDTDTTYTEASALAVLCLLSARRLCGCDAFLATRVCTGVANQFTPTRVSPADQARLGACLPQENLPKVPSSMLLYKSLLNIVTDSGHSTKRINTCL